MADISPDNLVLVSAVVCCFGALYTDFPALVGCSGKEECLCCEEEFCLKLNTPSYGVNFATGDGYICKLSLLCCQLGIKVPTVLCKGKGQCCCLVNAGACPPGGDVPIMCAICCVSLYPKFGICQKVGDNK